MLDDLLARGLLILRQQCGRLLRTDDRFCPHCGTSQQDLVEAPADVGQMTAWDSIFEKLAMATVVTMAVAIPVLVTLLTFENHGYAWQGRYELPLLFGLPLIAGAVSKTIPMGRAWDNAYIFVTGLAMGLAALCLALREGSAVVDAIAVVALSATGWWLLWNASWLDEHLRNHSPQSVPHVIPEDPRSA